MTHISIRPAGGSARRAFQKGGLMPTRPCLGFGSQTCRMLVQNGNRCPTHARMYEAARRPSAAARGYGQAYRTARDATLAASRICWLCGHDGADQADHVVARARGGVGNRANLRPAHGTVPCPTCGVRCNQSRGDGSNAA